MTAAAIATGKSLYGDRSASLTEMRALLYASRPSATGKLRFGPLLKMDKAKALTAEAKAVSVSLSTSSGRTSTQDPQIRGDGSTVLSGGPASLSGT